MSEEFSFAKCVVFFLCVSSKANATEENWNMTVTLIGNKAFTGPKSFYVEAKSVYQYPLTFNPQIEDDKFQAQLTINNNDTGFTQIYNLRGKSDRGPPVRSNSFPSEF